MTSTSTRSAGLPIESAWVTVSVAREAGTREWWYGSPIAGEDVRAVHVISPSAGGEIRGYWLDESRRLWLRAPCYTGEWAEVDLATARAVGATVVPYSVTAGGDVTYHPNSSWATP